MIHLIIPLLIFGLPLLPDAIQKWHIQEETAKIIEEECGTFAECRIDGEILRCWSIDTFDEVQVSELPMAIPTTTEIDEKVCAALNSIQI